MTQLTLNLFGRIDVNITADPALMAVLNRMFPDTDERKESDMPKPPFTDIKGMKVNYQVAVTGSSNTVTYDDEKCDPVQKEKTEEKVKESTKNDELVWNPGPNNSKIQWREDGTRLFLKYYTGIVETTWDKIHQLANIPVGMRKDPVERVILAGGGKWTANKRSAVNIFTELVSTGAIQDTEGTLRRMMASGTRLIPNQMAALN